MNKLVLHSLFHCKQLKHYIIYNTTVYRYCIKGSTWLLSYKKEINEVYSMITPDFCLEAFCE